MIKLALLAYVISATLLLGAAGVGLVFSSVHSILSFDKARDAISAPIAHDLHDGIQADLVEHRE